MDGLGVLMGAAPGLSAARCGSAGGAGDVGGDDVGGVPVEGGAGALVAHGCPGVGVAGGFLDFAQWDAGVEGGGDEGVPQSVWADRLGDAGAFGDTAHDAARAVPVEAVPVGAAEDRPVEPFADGQIEATGRAGCERDGDDLAALCVAPSGCGGRVGCPAR